MRGGGGGEASVAKLGLHRIATARDMRDADPSLVRGELGVVGVRTARELRGESCIPLDLAPQPRKSVVSSRSFGRPVTSADDVREAVAFHVAIAARKLRGQGSVAGVMSVFFPMSRFHEKGHHAPHMTCRLPVPTACTVELTGYAVRAVASAFRPGHSYVKAGVMMSDLSDDRAVQGNLFDPVDRSRSERLMGVMDEINDRLGQGALRLAALGLDRRWATKFAHRTPAYTTRWDELVRVRTDGDRGGATGDAASSDGGCDGS